VTAQGGVSRISNSDDLPGGASWIAIASGQRIVTAIRSGGKLKLTSWDLINNKLSRVDDSGDQGREANLIQIVALTDTLFLTAQQTGSGLLLTSWRLEANGSFTRLTEPDGNNQAGEVSEISLVVLRPRVGTAQVPTALVVPTPAPGPRQSRGKSS
jgi:hypothetical protein